MQGKFFIRIFISIFLFTVPELYGQNISGVIRDADNGEKLAGVIVRIKDGIVTTTDLNGNFVLDYKGDFPCVLVVSFTGFATKEINLESPSDKISVTLKTREVILSDVTVTGSRISEKQKVAALTVESMDVISIKECPQSSFYEALGTMKGVDLTTASLGFTIVNTRGFNSTSPVRSLQLIDGVDNQSPGLNFSLGNFLGSPELDVLKVDMIAGASSSYYGPNAFNGVISMTTKNPFIKPGLDVLVKAGERSLAETAARWAQVIRIKGRERLAYKLNFFYMKANDWEATNYDPTPQSKDGRSNPGSYDAVNRYGDEYSTSMDLSGSGLYPGVGRFYRTGYNEEDLVDYKTSNLKASVAVHYKITDSVEAIVASSFGTGTTVYQGDNRYSLKDILFFQNRVEIRKENKFFLRAYMTNEDAGKSYDAFFTALLLQKRSKSDGDFASDYYNFYKSNYYNRINNFPGYPQRADYPDYTSYINAINPFLLENYYDSLILYHNNSRDFANGIGRIPTNDPYLVPGTSDFDTAFASIVSKKSYSEGGSRFYDKSSLMHIQGEYKFHPAFAEIVAGGNYRMYKPQSQGTIFADTGSRKIENSEFGIYTGVEKKILDDRLTVNITARLDKNENFKTLFSPAASFVYSLTTDQIIRFSFSSAIRNPTLSDQFLYYNVGRALLVGNLTGYDSLVTIPSLFEYFNTLDAGRLEYFDVDPVRPEKVKTIEAGYRGILFENLYADVVGYYSWYNDFIGYKIGADVTVAVFAPYINNIYRVAANSNDMVTTRGFSAGVTYYLGKFYSLNGNYTYNKLDRLGSDDPLIPAFNTPENKFNISVGGRDIDAYLFKKIHIKNTGFNINYKWVQGFNFEGSPQFTGYVPHYDFVDAQVNYKVNKIKTTFKLGASNLLNNKKYTVYGGPLTGRLAYFSVLVEIH